MLQKRLLSAVKAREVDLSIINEKNYFLFTPLLHEVATGGLSPLSVTEPLREIFSNTPVSIYQGRVTHIETHTKKVRVGECHFHYDYLVLGTGAVTNYFNIPGASEYTFPIKTLENALTIRRKIIDAFEQANVELHEEERRKHLTFVIVGGGATGVEIAGEILEFAEKIYKRYYRHNPRIRTKDISVKLVHGGAKLLNGIDVRVQDLTERELKKKGVQIILNKKVTEVTRTNLKLSDGMVLSTTTVVWAGGVVATSPSFSEGGKEEYVRLEVDTYLRDTRDSSIFILGDTASFKNPSGDVVPALAQVAARQAPIVSKNFLKSLNKKPLTEFRYVSQGFLVSLGQWHAVAKIGPLIFHGKFAWFLWRTVYLLKFISFKKKLKIVIEWTANIFFPRDITKLN
jgi:NADH dehydrogenase